MVKALWKITAGIIPGEPMHEYERVFSYKASEWEADQARGEGQPTRFAEIQREAHEYFTQLTDPRVVNWVTLEFLWY